MIAQQADAGFRGLVPAESRTARERRGLSSALGLPNRLRRDRRSSALFAPIDSSCRRKRANNSPSLSGRLARARPPSSKSLRPGRCALEAAKAEALAEFAAGAGHEINNPLATIAGRVQILLRDETDANRRQDLATIGAQALRVRDMIGDLMLFGRPPAPRPERLLLNDLRAIGHRPFRGGRQLAVLSDLDWRPPGPYSRRPIRRNCESC